LFFVHLRLAAAAGDVADTAAAVAAALRLLSSRFARVVWLPGNHEAWLRPGSRDGQLYSDSFAKLLALRQVRLTACLLVACLLTSVQCSMLLLPGSAMVVLASRQLL
jgi:hypothetical protein